MSIASHRRDRERRIREGTDENGNPTPEYQAEIDRSYGYSGPAEEDTPDEARARARHERESQAAVTRMRAQSRADDHPLLGALFGDGGSEERERADNEIGRLAGSAPTAEELTPEYSYLPDSEAGQAAADADMIEAQKGALGQLQEWSTGEMTDADMARRDLGRRSLARDEASQRAGVTRGMQERGLGGSGLEMMGTLGAQQGMADRLSAQDSAMEVAVQDRALRATEAAGSLASQGRGQSYGEAQGRGTAVDRFNAYNTDTRNRQADARTRARADEYQNTEDMAAMAMGQYNRNADADRAQADRNRGIAGDVVGWFGDAFTDDEEG